VPPLPAHGHGHVGQTHPCPRNVLRANPAKRFEHFGNILGGDAAPVIADLKHRGLGAAFGSDHDRAGAARFEGGHRVGQEIPQDLFHGGARRPGLRYGVHAHLRLMLGELMGQRLHEAGHQRLHVQGLKSECTAAQTGQVQDGLEEAIHAGDRGMDAAQRFGDVLRQGTGHCSPLGRGKRGEDGGPDVLQQGPRDLQSPAKPFRCTSGARRSWETIEAQRLTSSWAATSSAVRSWTRRSPGSRQGGVVLVKCLVGPAQCGQRGLQGLHGLRQPAGALGRIVDRRLPGVDRRWQRFALVMPRRECHECCAASSPGVPARAPIVLRTSGQVNRVPALPPGMVGPCPRGASPLPGPEVFALQDACPSPSLRRARCASVVSAHESLYRRLPGQDRDFARVMSSGKVPHA
jgi:hypothetical protein